MAAILHNKLAAFVNITDFGRVIVSFPPQCELGQNIGLWTVNVLPVQVHDGSVGSFVKRSAGVVTLYVLVVQPVFELLY